MDNLLSVCRVLLVGAFSGIAFMICMYIMGFIAKAIRKL